ncbi:glutamine synthetase family protein [Chachezhania sediminis]|uniref:glutamine synthetase family protein n=1 Tax=Chachezhania sediminis TaxID=2599291 RepID=UPI00131AC769|nr:glutamine synthetase family protein [Chachezhania sediminis]
MNFEEQAAAYGPEYDAAQERMKAAGVEFLQTHVVDITGLLRSKITPFKLSTSGDALNGILYCVSRGDGQPDGDTIFGSYMANEENGFPNIKALVDPASLRQHGWRPDMASVISTGYMLDGSPCAVDPRHVLANADAALRAQGYEAQVALEYEFGIFHADHALMQQGRYRELKPWGHSLVNYDLVRGGDYQDLVTEFMRRMDSLGIGVASMVTEYGYGMYEFALKPKPAVEAADDAVRAKLHLKELCAERGLVATFMTRFQPPGRESACGGHHHVSLWQDGQPAMAAGTGALSPVGQQFLAGMLEYLPDTHAMFRPTVNSFRRFDRGAWSPEDVSWGYENRAAAIRAITTPNAGACRFEHRVAGADVNPYLTVAAILAAGTRGLERGLTPPTAQPGMAPDGAAKPLQDSLRAAAEDFGASAFCKEVFGEVFVTHYTESLLNEVRAFEAWQAARITDFEWQRYFV